MRDTTALPMPRTAVTGALYDNSKLFGGRVRITAFGRMYEDPDIDEDWSFRNLRTPEDGKSSDCSLTRYLPDIAKELEIAEILVPSPIDFNARMCLQKDLNIIIPVGNHLVLRRGTNADGCRIQRGQTYGVSLAGCALVVAIYPHNPHPGEKIKVAVAHSGFDSVFDRQEALTGLRSRKPQSVTESLLNAMGCSGLKTSRRKRVGIIVAFPISSKIFTYSWDHPQFGENNERICEYIRERWGSGCVPGNNGTSRQGAAREGRINLAEIITRQFVELGVSLEHINIILDSDVFFGTEHPRGGEMWYTTRGQPRFKNHRNLLLVSRMG